MAQTRWRTILFTVWLLAGWGVFSIAIAGPPDAGSTGEAKEAKDDSRSPTQLIEGCSGDPKDCEFPCSKIDELLRIVRKGDVSVSYPVSEWSCRTDESCAKSEACLEEGFCEKGRDGICMLGREGCESSKACRLEGRCTATMTGCQAVTDTECAASQFCKKEGRCHLLGGRCVTTDELPSCPPKQVVIDGECHYPKGYDCKKECAEEDLCGALETRLRDDTRKASKPFVVCVESKKQCREWDLCRDEGLCVPRGAQTYSFNKCNGYRFEVCAGTSYDGCGPSRSSCAKSKDCKLVGDCATTLSSNICRPTKIEHCQQATRCKSMGMCGLEDISGGYTCAATKPEHCKESTRCKTHGECVLRGGTCEKPAS